MERDKISPNDKPPLHTSPSPLYIKRILNAKRQYSESFLRVKVSGAEMCNIYRAFHGRLNISYRRPEDNEQVCIDAMDLLDQIAIFRGCEPSVIISYIAIVREVYLHACTNLKKEDISVQERKTKMLEQWGQIEKHFAKIKYAMLDCWPMGNESDLMAAYVSIALLYSLYKEVCDERIIRQCYEAAERARKCGRSNLSESQFNEVQQYCDMIENIFFLRRQRSTMNNGENHYVNSGNVNDDHDDQSGGNNDTENDSHLQLSNQQQLTPAPTACINLLKYDSDNSLNSHSALRRIKDGPAILAEYGQLTTAGKTATCEKICQKRLRPSDFEIKTAQKKLKYQKPTNSVTILTEFEAVLLARNAVSNGDFEFLRPSDLKLNRNSENFKLAADTQYYGPKFSLPNVCPTAAENLGSLKTNPEDLNSSNSIHQVLKSCLSPVESQSSTNQKGDKMASVINIMNKDTLISGSSQAADTSYSSSVRDEVSETESIKIGRAINHTQANIVFPTLESYVNEFVGKIIHSVIEMNKERRKCSQRNSETFQITDTVASTALTSDNCPVPKQESIVKFSNTSEGVEPDGANKNILICTERILKENIDQQIEDVIIESVAKTTAVGVIADSNSNDTLKRDKYNSEGMSVRRIVVEDYAEMELSHDHMPESLYNLQQTSESITNSDLSLIASQVKSSPSVTSVTTAVPSNLANLGNKSEQERKKMKTDSVTDADDEDEVETYMVSDHLTEVNKVIGREESNGKFGKVSETLQKLEASKQQQSTATTETTSIIPAAKFSQKQMKNQADPDYIFEEFDDRERKYTVTKNEFLVSTRNMFSGTDKSIFSVIWTNNEVVSSAAITNQQLQATGQKEITALTSPDDFNCSSGSASVQRLNYTPEISLMEVISNVTENLIETLEKSDVSQVKSQNEQEILFEKYANFEPPSCRLQRVPEFDAVPLSMEQLLSKSRLQFQMFPAESKIPDQTRYREYISDSTKKVQEITKKMNSCKTVSESFPGIIHSSSEQTGLKAVGSTDISTVQIELIAESDFQQRNQPLLTPDSISLISPFSQVIASNLETTTPFRTDQDPVITKFETNEYIASEQKIEKKNSVIKSKPVLKGTFDKTESSFTRNNSREEMKLNSFTVVPEMKQISLLRSQTAPPCPPPRQRLNKPTTSVSSRSLLPRRSKHFFMKSKKPVEASAFEANFTLSGCDDKKPDFTISKIYQASSSQETGLLDISKEMKSELEKFWNDAIYEEQQRRSKISSGTIWDLENKLSPSREGNNEQMNDDQVTNTSSASVEIIQIPHFDAKAEFDRRLSVKKSRRGDVPVIVKSAILKSNNKLQLLRSLTEDSLISSTLRLSASEKPDFNFIIKNK